MNGINNPIVFYPIAILLISFAFLTIKAKNIFYSLLSAIVVFILSAVIFYVLGSEYNAIVQFAIYGVAVPIILGLCIMFSGQEKKVQTKKNHTGYILILCATAVIFILACIYLILTSLSVVPQGFNVSFSENINSMNTMQAFGQGIFSKYVFAFELIAIILTIAIVGLNMFKKEEKTK